MLVGMNAANIENIIYFSIEKIIVPMEEPLDNFC